MSVYSHRPLCQFQDSARAPRTATHNAAEPCGDMGGDMCGVNMGGNMGGNMQGGGGANGSVHVRHTTQTTSRNIHSRNTHSRNIHNPNPNPNRALAVPTRTLCCARTWPSSKTRARPRRNRSTSCTSRWPSRRCRRAASSSLKMQMPPRCWLSHRWHICNRQSYNRDGVFMAPLSSWRWCAMGPSGRKNSPPTRW